MTPRQKESPEIEREHVGSIGMTQFALRQWDRDFVGTRIEGISPEELVRLVNDALKDGAPLVDGYAPFCKHLFIENTTT